MVLERCRLFFVLLFAGGLLLISESAARGQETNAALRALGDDNQSLLLVTSKLPPGAGTFGMRGPDENKETFWTAAFRRGVTDAAWTQMAMVAGYVNDATIYKGQLVLLMGDGNWRTVYAGGSTAGEPLPRRNQRLRMLAGEGPALLAYVIGDAAPRLARLEPAGWADLGEAPAVGSLADMIYRNGRVVLAMKGANGRVTVMQSTPLTDPATRPSAAFPASSTAPTSRVVFAAATQPVTWEPLGGPIDRVEAAPAAVGALAAGPSAPAGAVRLLPLGNELAVWPGPGTSEGGVVYQLGADATWTPLVELGKQNGELAAAARRLRFYYDVSEKKIVERIYDFAGKQLGEPAEVDLGRSLNLVRQLSELVLGLATAGLMLAIVLSWRRRERITPEVVETARKLPLAPLGRRLLSGMIDNSPWLAALGYLVYRGELTFDVAAWKSMNSVVALLLAYATVVTHTMITEVIFGRTLGMTAAGLYVANLAGKRPTAGALVIRNLFRAVDLILLLPWLFVAFSPLRQSLGDAAAGTLVLARDSSTIPTP